MTYFTNNDWTNDPFIKSEQHWFASSVWYEEYSRLIYVTSLAMNSPSTMCAWRWACSICRTAGRNTTFPCRKSMSIAITRGRTITPTTLPSCNCKQASVPACRPRSRPLCLCRRERSRRGLRTVCSPQAGAIRETSTTRLAHHCRPNCRVSVCRCWPRLTASDELARLSPTQKSAPTIPKRQPAW